MTKEKLPVVTIDAETDPFSDEFRRIGRIPKPFCWGVFDGEKYHEIWATLDEFGDTDYLKMNKELVQYLFTTYGKGARVYAHNGGKFDYFYLLEHLTGKPRIINGRISEASLRRNPKIKFFDSYNIMPVPLSAIEKDEFNYEKMDFRVREKYKLEILKYLKNDCVYLWHAVTTFIENFGINLTVSGASIKQLKITGYEVPKTFEDHDNIFRKYYHGGRVECFEKGIFKTPLKFFDINSAYPWAMTLKHPHGKPVFIGDELPTNKNALYFATIKAVTKGCLVYKEKVDGIIKSFYPTDDEPRIYNTTSWEIQAGLRTGTLEILEVIECWAYPVTRQRDFKEFVYKFYELKAQAKEDKNKTMELFYKLILNSCYGKFGIDGRKFEEIIIDDGEIEFYRSVELAELENPQLEDEDTEKYNERIAEQVFYFYARTDDGIDLYSRPTPKLQFIDVAVASSITGCVRAYLFEHIHKCKRPIYCDTDSILCEEFTGAINKELGGWDYEGMSTDSYIVAKKMYACKLMDLDENGLQKLKVACKGVRLSYAEIKHGTDNATQCVRYENIAPSFSLSMGVRYIHRELNFKNMLLDTSKNPPLLEVDPI